MDRATDERWRAALEKKGLDAVRQKLELRPGPPNELLFDVVDEPPYPDRAFCDAWCRGAPPPSAGMSRAGTMVLIMGILVVVCGLRAFNSLSPADANWLSPSAGPYHPAAKPVVPPGGGAAGTSDTNIQNNALVNQARQNGSTIATQAPSILPACTAVSSANTVATVRSTKPCSKLGQPFNTLNNAPGTGSGGGSGG